jgi:4'-phosphopantetheinyl transferase
LRIHAAGKISTASTGNEMELDGNQVNLYFVHPEQVTEPALLRRYQALLTEDELQQMSRLYFAGHRHQYLLTRALIRTCLSFYYPVEPGEWRFSKNDYGKPQVSHPQVKPAACFNLSHAQGLIICGIAAGVDIGVDVEDTQRTTRAAFDSLASYFSEEEIRDLRELPEEQQKQRFFDYWTLKEAYIKARGMGFALPLDRFGFRFKANQLDGFSIHPDLEDDAEHWQFWRTSVDGRYQVAVAVNSPQRDFEVKAFNTVPLISHAPIALNFL